MRRIVHLSDIHFGSVEDRVVDRAVECIRGLEPHLVVVSGDLTQRARSRQFIEAKKFLDQLPQPQIVVPGNHDVPLYNVFDRFLRPLEKFRKFITDDLTPTFFDDELAVMGVNTARSLVIKGGRINHQQIRMIRDEMCRVPDTLLKMIVTHHPFDIPEGSDERDIVGRAKLAVPMIAECGADVFLSGHLHISNVETMAKRYRLENGRAALVVQAGTATSVRARGEARSFNVLEFEHPILAVHRYECMDSTDGFKPADVKRYRQTSSGWERDTSDSR
jgi:3',5'-cyclic AMP phosphodiesterase CpdA